MAVNGAITITGTKIEDQTLTANTSGLTDPDGLGIFSYQWSRDGSDINGATTSTYILTQDDVGTEISSTVSYINPTAISSQISNNGLEYSIQLSLNHELLTTSDLAGVTIVNLSFTGFGSSIDDGLVATSGSYASWTTITGTRGDLNALDTVVEVNDFTDNIFTTSGDWTTGYSTSVPLTVSDSVSSWEFSNINIRDYISDTVAIGTLNFAVTENVTDFEITINGTVSGLSSDQTTPQSETLNSLTFDVIGNPEANIQTVTSAVTSAVVNVNDAPSGTVTINGIATEDETLTAGTSALSDEDGLGAFLYQWLRDGSNITDANTMTYVLTQADVTKNISVKVSYTDGEGTAESVTSSATSSVAKNSVSIYSNASVNLTDLDMSRLANYSSTTFHDNVSYSVFGNIYSDVLEVYWELEGTNYLTAFGGPIIEVDGDAITGGTVTGFIEYYWNGAEWFPFLGVDGFSVSAKELYQTVGTIDTSDEYAIFTAALSGNDVFYLSAYDESINGYAGDDAVNGGQGSDFLLGGEGNDTITLTGNITHDGKFAHNVSSTTQVATDVRINLSGKVKLETVVDGGADADTVNLSSSGDAFFLHDSFSGFHSSLTLTTDTHTGGASTQRIMNVETINGLGGDDIIDLTSPDYSLAGQVITINGGAGNDVIWGSDATETLIGGDGNDILFGGSGNDTLTGGSGADTFEFTRTAGSDTITDFQSGTDTIKLYIDYTFDVSKTDSTTSDYSIDDQSDPTLYLARGKTYTFEMSGNGHPFYIKSTSSTSGTSDEYIDGVTRIGSANSGSDGDTLQFTATAETPDTLWYQCSSHSGMLGKINIVDTLAQTLQISGNNLIWNTLTVQSDTAIDLDDVSFVAIA